MCQCFRCGLKLHQWDPDIDDPRMQHDKFNPNSVQNFQLLLDTDFNYGFDKPDTPLWKHKKVKIDKEIEQLKKSIQDLKEAGLEENSECVQLKQAMITSLEEEIKRVRDQDEDQRANNRSSYKSDYVKSMVSVKNPTNIIWSAKNTKEWDEFRLQISDKTNITSVNTWFETVKDTWGLNW